MRCAPLTHADQYTTSPNAALPLLRHLPTPLFFLFLVRIVSHSGLVAAKGHYSYQAWCHASRRVLRLLEYCGCHLHISGLHHLQQLAHQPCVVVANHMSTLETFVLPNILLPWQKTTFVIKESLIRYPIFGHVMRFCDPIVVGRSNPRQDLQTVLNEGQNRLTQGHSVLIFPQHTRHDAFDPHQFNSIGCRLAHKAGVPVLPLALHTSAWSNGRWFKDYGGLYPQRPIHFAFGEPLATEGGHSRHTQQQVVAFIMEHLRTWQAAIAEEPSAGPQ